MKILQILTALLIVTLVYFTIVQASSSANELQVIRARSFELVDDKGQVRASLVVESNGETVFRLKDSKGEIRVKMGASETGSGLVLLNGNTNPGIHALTNNNSTSITLTDTSGNKLVVEP